MQRRADVRVRVEHVEPRDEAREGIVAWEDIWPEHLTGGKEEIDNERYRVGDHHEAHHAAKARHVEKERVGHRADEVDEPEHVGNEEPFIKRNQIVERAVHFDVVRHGVEALDIRKAEAEKRPVE